MNEHIENIIENAEEIVNVIPEEIVPVAKSHTGLKIGGAATATAVVGFGIYKAVKWIAPKIKAKKAAKEELKDDNVVHFINDNDDEVEETADK